MLPIAYAHALTHFQNDGKVGRSFVRAISTLYSTRVARLIFPTIFHRLSANGLYEYPGSVVGVVIPEAHGIASRYAAEQFLHNNFRTSVFQVTGTPRAILIMSPYQYERTQQDRLYFDDGQTDAELRDLFDALNRLPDGDGRTMFDLIAARRDGLLTPTATNRYGI